MTANIEIAAIMQPFALTLARLTPLFMAVNASPLQYFPMMVRLILMLAIGAILVGGSGLIGSLPVYTSPWQWGANLVYELVLGMLMLLGFQLAIAAIQMMGRLLDMQIGFAAAGVIDPQTNNNDPLLGHIVVLFVTLALFLTNTHHQLFYAFKSMLMLIPLGSWNGDINVSKIAGFFGAQLSFALLLLGPIAMGLWLMDMFSGVVSKTMPQMNVYFVTLPIKIWLGMYLFSLALKYVKPLLSKIFFSIESWMQAGWLTGVVK